MRGFPVSPTIAILGIAFKGRPPTDDLRGTMARPIVSALQRQYPGAICRGFDAVVAPEDIRGFGLEPCGTLEQVLDGAHLAVIANNHAVFAGMPIETLAQRMARPGLIYDFWNHFDARDLRMPPSVGYMALGSHGHGRLPDGMK
jgi:UDP-N-acetyl-D-mannosaminuronic acid dehydrogenase